LCDCSPWRNTSGILDRITFDGNGHFTDSVTFNDDGTITHRNDSGTYTVNADCTFFPPSGGTIQIVIVDAGKEFYQLRTQPSNIVFQSNGAKKQFPDDQDRECSNASLNGAYGFLVVQADIPARTPRAALGRANFDGKGNFTSTVTVNDNGSVTQIDGKERNVACTHCHDLLVHRSHVSQRI